MKACHVISQDAFPPKCFGAQIAIHFTNPVLLRIVFSERDAGRKLCATLVAFKRTIWAQNSCCWNNELVMQSLWLWLVKTYVSVLAFWGAFFCDAYSNLACSKTVVDNRRKFSSLLCDSFGDRRKNFWICIVYYSDTRRAFRRSDFSACA